MRLEKSRLREGFWEGLLTGWFGDNAPPIRVSHPSRAVDDVQLDPVPGETGSWFLKIGIPIDCLNDGVQTFAIESEETGEQLSSFTIVADEPIDNDMRAEIGLLRAELDMLKKAFRRHCAEDDNS